MPHPKNGNKNTHVCVGGVRGHVCSQVRAGRRTGVWTPGRDSSSLGSYPCPLPPAQGRWHCSQGTQSWKCSTRPLVALRWPSAAGCDHRRGQKSASSAADPSPSRSGGPTITEAAAQCLTPGDQRPQRGSPPSLQTPHYLRLSSSAQGLPSWASTSQDASPAETHRVLGFRHGGRWEEGKTSAPGREPTVSASRWGSGERVQWARGGGPRGRFSLVFGKNLTPV